MDYKNQSGNQPDPGQAFFTPGAGDVSPLKNNVEPENNLDLTNTSTSWPASESVEPIKEALNPQEITPPGDMLNTPMPDIEMKNGLGETIDADLPPAAMQASPPNPTPKVLPVAAFDEKLIRTEGDSIDREALPEIDRAINNLGKTGNTADFYTTVRGDNDKPGMLGSNLENSYGRKLK